MFSSSTAAFSPPSHAALRSTTPVAVGAELLRPQPCFLAPKPASRSPGVIFPLAASVSILLWTTPVNAGILSGFSGLESVPGPQLPQIDFLKQWNDTNQKKYAENDSRFKESSVLKELLEKSRLNKERNKREIQDKYCLRGAEWGVGDCSTEGMTQEERDDFVAMLKKRTRGD
ncbi:hypothetical protein Cni_G10422 [Canna indica]|uniref:Uncharacterized protein n=1 Tax=Canna indica TaxID=4628 RepID=A0AAQ3K4F8_9LILI|nr:hypothetical protein Cni_G10422 [Canna indica]